MEFLTDFTNYTSIVMYYKNYALDHYFEKIYSCCIALFCFH